ncbi:hypothetical protein QJS10_CPA01g02442 [Acorus calamus]|uniref:Uncharacterized protein n=1 Tax=Acorus calamus TaxID=4465 RepID=A0AAV9FG49_ACOCL|nr:hypothetical protein QJS10_CPA01g02442 [Acorus calamus]
MEGAFLNRLAYNERLLTRAYRVMWHPAIQKTSKPPQQHPRTHSFTPPTKTSSASTTSTTAADSPPQAHPLNPQTGGN